MPCFSKTSLITDKFTPSRPKDKNLRASTAAPGTSKHKECAKEGGTSSGPDQKELFESPYFDTKLFPKKVREQCIDALQVKGFEPDQMRRFLKKPPEPKQKMGPDVIRKVPPKWIKKEEMDRLKAAAKVATIQERVAGIHDDEDRKLELAAQAEETAKHFKEIDEARRALIAKQGDKSNAADPRIEEKNRVLDRVFVAKYEQEQEVKDVDRLILSTKCTAIRDAQILEKTIMENKLKEAEAKLEKAVIANSLATMANEEDNLCKEREKKAKYAAEIREQLRQRDNLRFLESQRLEEEARVVRITQEALKREEEKEKQIACERRMKLRDEYNKVFEMTKLFKQMLCEQERESELRIAAYLKAKRENEKKIAEEKKLLKQAFERKQATIYMLASKALQSKTQSDEMALMREQERAEREYRKKEKEAALRKIQYEKELCENRQKQMEEVKHRRALQIARAEEEFNAMLERIRQEQIKEEEKEKLRQCRRDCYRQAIIQQMADKEMERRRYDDLNRHDNYMFLEAERQREANIQAVIKAKLEAMRQACLPEKYIQDVQKQIAKLECARKKKTNPN